MKKFMLLVSALTLFGWASAQSNFWKAPVEKPVTGWQRIALAPELTAHMNRTFENFRIYDSQQKEIPYLLQVESPQEVTTEIKWLPFAGKKYYDRYLSRVNFKNTSPNSIDRLVLKVRNADVSRRFWLSGSDDNKNWFIIKEDYVYDHYYDARADYDLIGIHFPKSSYKYFKVEVKHRWREPIQLLGAGYYDMQLTQGKYQELPTPEVSQLDSAEKKTSTVYLEFDANHYFDRILLEVDGPERYHRFAEFQEKVTNDDGKFWYKRIKSFNITSKAVNQLEFQNMRGQHFRIVIHNNDDLPIRISGVRGFQLRKYALTELEASGEYAVHILGEDTLAPKYDLVHFAEELPEEAPMVGTAALQKLAGPVLPKPEPEVETQPLLSNKLWLWGGVIAIVLLLGFFTVRMIKNMDS